MARIKTSAANKERVRSLTRRFALGSENIIARVAIGYSLGSGVHLSLNHLQDSEGKEYSYEVLLGTFASAYMVMICAHYGISLHDKNISRYLKLHLDHGLECIAYDLEKNPNLVGLDYLLAHTEKRLKP